MPLLKFFRASDFEKIQGVNEYCVNNDRKILKMVDAQEDSRILGTDNFPGQWIFEF